MYFNCNFRLRIFCLALLILSVSISGFAGVSRQIQEQYKREYENKAMFLKIPIYAEKQIISISGRNIKAEQGAGTPRYKVGDQLRVLGVDFSGDEIKFRLSGIATAGLVEIGFRFDAPLQETFPNRDVFDRALQSTLTEGLKYTEIDDAKRSYVEEQFERLIKEIAESASISRESVLKNIAPLVPAYQDAQRENDSLKNRLQDVSSQLSQSQSANRKLEADSKAQQAELSRLKFANAALQEKIDNSTQQMSKLGDELRDVKGNEQGYQKELANIQRSLNLKVDTARDLTAQIAELGQAMRQLQKENGNFANQINSLRASVDSQRAANASLLKDNDELKAGNQKMQSTINTLTSKEDSLARRYINLSNEKEKLEDFYRAVAAIRTRIEEEKTEGGFRYGKANIYLKSVQLGSLTWSIPMYLSHAESEKGEVTFSAESIDYVRISQEERNLLLTLGGKLKVRAELVSSSKTMTATPESDKSSREIGERDHSTWRWTLKSQGSRDASLLITVRLINKNSSEIPVFQQENALAASNAVRQIRGYLQPVPLAIGIVLGFLLFGIVGIFRRSKSKDALSKKSSSSTPPVPPSFPGKKQL
jgi:predicted nuclease with TOPRIM domain